MDGYPKIAGLMSRHHELAIFRRFDELNYRNILYLQAELVQLEDELREIATQDQESPSRTLYARDWSSLAQSESEGDGRLQWQKVLLIREKLEKYNQALAQQVFLARLDEPCSYDLAFFRDWLRRPNMGNFPLRGLDRLVWDEKNISDLFAIKRRESRDPFSRWFINRFVVWFHETIGHRMKRPLPEEADSEICQYSESRLLKISDIIGTLLASILPISSILILYFVTNMLFRLSLVVIFTVLFSIALLLFTNAKKIETFAATSAFAAIQVVFISGSSGFAE